MKDFAFAITIIVVCSLENSNRMGSSFSVVNDTKKPIWVSDGVCHAALWGSIGGVLAVVTAGAGTAAVAAGRATAAAAAEATIAAAAATGAAESSVLVGTMTGIVLPEIALIALPTATIAGISAAGWAAIGTVSGLLSFTAGAVAGLSGEDEKKVLSAKKDLEKRLEGYTCIQPGCKHTVSGSLSLVWTAYVIYDDGREAKRDCWTGATANSENLYPVSEYF